MRTVFLHVGTGKTGTSFVQETLAGNKVKLDKHGILYPITGRGANAAAHHQLLPALSNTPKWWMMPSEDDASVFARLLSEIDESKAEIVYISQEGLVWIERNMIERLKAVFKDFNVKIVIDFRRQDDYVDSALNQVVKTAGFTYSYDKLWNYDASWFVPNYHLQATKWASVFGNDNVIIRPYERQQFINGNIVDDFFSRTIGTMIELDPVSSNVADNAKLSQVSLEFKRLLNWIFADLPQESLRFLKCLFDFDKAFNLTEGNIIGAQVRIDLYRACMPQNMRIAQEFSQNQTLPDKLFVEAFSVKNKPKFEGITEDQLISLLSFIKAHNAPLLRLISSYIDKAQYDSSDEERIDIIRKRL
ncbi:hypothetical protein [Cohaesibacter intestini]|uniref:hypothetical protein n=1 Tax=Cohaesibacter intestini TaxID=2211145 RepID=UPI000DEBC0BD|nr:hypothetical protein [Cohaesibacter intestini]